MHKWAISKDYKLLYDIEIMRDHSMNIDYMKFISIGKFYPFLSDRYNRFFCTTEEMYRNDRCFNNGIAASFRVYEGMGGELMLLTNSMYIGNYLVTNKDIHNYYGDKEKEISYEELRDKVEYWLESLYHVYIQDYKVLQATIYCENDGIYTFYSMRMEDINWEKDYSENIDDFIKDNDLVPCEPPVKHIYYTLEKCKDGWW